MEKIDKLSAAVRQLHTAVELYFTGKDILSVHTLAGASHRILEDTAPNKEATYLLENIFKNIAGDSANSKKARKIFFNHIKNQQNFLKHAEKDPNGTFQFKKEHTEGILLLACINITGRCSELNTAEMKKITICMCCTAFLLAKQIKKEEQDLILSVYQDIASKLKLPEGLTLESEVEFYQWVIKAEKWIRKNHHLILPFFEEDIKAYSSLPEKEFNELAMQSEQGRFYSPPN